MDSADFYSRVRKLALKAVKADDQQQLEICELALRAPVGVSELDERIHRARDACAMVLRDAEMS